MPWYDPGLRFECTMCGNCCSGPPGYVLFSDEEARALAASLSISVERFIEQYTTELPHEIAGRTRSLREIAGPHGLDCVFLDRASVPGKALCRVHGARPTQCRTFPFWPEHAESRDSWRRLARDCEGIDRGSFVPAEEITRRLREQRADRDRKG